MCAERDSILFCVRSGRVMKKRIFVIIVTLLVMAATMCTFPGCWDEEEQNRDIKIELVNPNTGEAVGFREKIEIPPENTPIVFRVIDVETGKALTDDDLPETTLEDSINYNRYSLLFLSGETVPLEYRYTKNKGYWPSEAGYYRISVRFDCLPEDNKEIGRKYKRRIHSYSFELINTEEGE